MWGVWVSLSKDSFDHYVETYQVPSTKHGYFGWFSNYLPYYEDTYALATNVHLRANGERPYIQLHESEHQLYQDFKNGITVALAQEIAERCMHTG
mgnify:CR=1 FL=1